MAIPEHIACVECGGRCSRLTYEPEEGFEPGDVVAYRCHECLERWDVEVSHEDVWEEGPGPLQP